MHREHIIRSLQRDDKADSRATAPARRAVALASADSAPLPAGFQFSSSPSTSAMYAGPPMNLLERDLSDSQVSPIPSLSMTGITGLDSASAAAKATKAYC